MNQPQYCHALPPAARFLRAAACFIGLVLAPFALGQGVVSAGLTGIIRDTSGKPVAGAAVVAKHVPTGTSYDAATNDQGRYNFRGLIVGGPYTVTVEAASFKKLERNDVTTELGQDVDLNFTLEPASSVVVMDKFTVKDEALALDSNASGAGSLLTRDRLLLQPTSNRSFADMTRTNAMVSLRNVFGDRQEGMITAVGTNNRFNSVMLDGARINDAFGLNASGLQSFFNPLSLETVEQFSIATSPYDVRQSGFTGAAVNAVTRSGTNEFHGSVYGYYSDQKYAAKDYVGLLANTQPFDERKTWGATLGGPILKDRLFFFGNYEKFHRSQVAPPPGFTPAAADLATINNAIASIKTASGKTFDAGSFGGLSAFDTEEEKKLYKVDWNILKGHRLSVRYNETVGNLPQFGRLSTTGAFANQIVASQVPASSAATAYTSNFYTQIRTEKVYAGTLNDQWSPSLKTEFKYAKTSYEQLTTTPINLPEIRIYGVSGTNIAGAPITNGVLLWGSEQFRHGNIIRVNTQSYSANADYFWKDFTFTAGFDRERNKFYNLFRQGSYGLFDYASIAAFVADTPTVFRREFYVQGTGAAEESGFTDVGAFVQAKWDVSPRLNFTAGIREDWVSYPTRPPLNQGLLNTFGVRNDGSVDGTEAFSPRIGFNWAIDAERERQVRGGVGHFAGRAPGVFISNVYGTSGVNRYGISQGAGQTTTTVPKLGDYLKTFDPANPIGTSATDLAFNDPLGRRTVNLLQDGLKLPSVWRGNLAFDQRIPKLGITVSLEAVHTKNDTALFSDQLNIKPLVVTATSGPAVGLDGRQRFNGGSGTAGAVSTFYADVIRTRNVSVGGTQYYSIAIDRPMKDNWAFNLAYTRGKATEAQSTGQTVAVDGWTRNAVFNQNTVEEGRSDFEIRDRVQATLSRRFALEKGWDTKMSLYYEGHTGNPFSYTYSGDLNGDGVSNNDLVYVPTGPSDTKVDFSGMTAAQQTDFFNFLNVSGLSKYAGRAAPRNAFTQPWIHQLDLRVTQKVPLFKPLEAELFFDFTNFGYWLSRRTFGYTRLLTNTNNAVYYRRLMGAATYNATGQIRPTYTAEPGGPVIDNVASRWRMQFGAAIKF